MLPEKKAHGKVRRITALVEIAWAGTNHHDAPGAVPDGLSHGDRAATPPSVMGRPSTRGKFR
jgi:hypothetical protein